MAYRQHSTDEAKISRLCEEGRGQGRGANYIPWIKIYDIASRGRSHRAIGRKSGRIHHFLSDIEWCLFLYLDWCEDVTDIREQFPLNRAITRPIAENLGVRHPIDAATKTPHVMTTDFLVDLMRDGKALQEACYVKPAAELEKPRVIELLEIERRFWAEQNIPFRIVTEKDFSPVVTRNLKWLRMLSFVNQSEPWEGFHEEQLTAVLQAIPRFRHLTLKQFCTHLDPELALEAGSTLAVVRYLLMTRAVAVDLATPLNDHRSMAEFKLRIAAVGQEVA